MASSWSRNAFAVGFLVTAAAAAWSAPKPIKTPAPLPPDVEIEIPLAVDTAYEIQPSQFNANTSGTWETAWIENEFPFDELIYYWKSPLERNQGWRLYLQVKFAEGATTGPLESPWLYGGYWGRVPYTGKRTEPEFDQGSLEQDQLLLKDKASAYRFRVVDEGKRPMAEPPMLGVIATDNEPSAELITQHGVKKNSPTSETLVLDLPMRRQRDTAKNALVDRCQSAALATAMQYYGTSVPLEQIIAHTTDPEYRVFGIWPRTIATAHEFGFDAYLDRFRTWDKVVEALRENKVILASMTMPLRDRYIDPPYPRMSGHIVALAGVTSDGRVLVTDSARSKTGYLEQWRRQDFEKIWMRNKGGVGMVIMPPDDAQVIRVEDIAPFPDYAPARAEDLKRIAKEEAEKEAEKRSGKKKPEEPDEF